MHFLQTTFKDYCKTKNIQILRDDLKFIGKKIASMPQNEQRSVMRDYTDKWLSIIQNEEKSSQNQNLARFTCNMWLISETKKRREQNEPGRMD